VSPLRPTPFVFWNGQRLDHQVFAGGASVMDLVGASNKARFASSQNDFKILLEKPQTNLKLLFLWLLLSRASRRFTALLQLTFEGGNLREAFTFCYANRSGYGLDYVDNIYCPGATSANICFRQKWRGWQSVYFGFAVSHLGIGTFHCRGGRACHC
jgi:hypothetical protein